MVNNLKSRRNKKAGFTLIELLVVILILGILIAVAIPLYLTSVRNAGTRTVQANVKTIAQASQAYRVKKGAYPTTLALLNAEGDLTQSVLGPTGVGYTIGLNATNEFEITATETTDVFGDEDTNNALKYNLSSGAWTPTGFTL